MLRTRREFLTLSALASASALLAACGPTDAINDFMTSAVQVPERAARAARAMIVSTVGASAHEPSTTTHDPSIVRALKRLTFGPRLTELAYAQAIGLPTWIEEQLAPDSLDDTDALLRLRRFDTLSLDASIIFDVRQANVTRELQQLTLLRAIYSRRQLYELMVDFWSDHFSISTQKADCAWLKIFDDRIVIRKHALGNFRDLLWASMQSPAMLKYLDNQENHKHKPNENYARELLELHTLGVDAGYTQQDVQAVARCLTGWTVDARWRKGQFRFDAAQHAEDEKRVLGHVIAANGGAHDGERICDLLMAHPATARFIARKLVRRFVADEPPAALVAATAETFTQTQGDIRAMLKTILYSDLFAAAPPKFKRPFHFVAGVLRQLDAETDGGQPLLDFMRQMGQPLFQWPTPDGFPDNTTAWSANPLARWQFVLKLVAGGFKGTQLSLPKMAEAIRDTDVAHALQYFATLLLGAPLPHAASETLLEIIGRDLNDESLQRVVATLLIAPQYQWR